MIVTDPCGFRLAVAMDVSERSEGRWSDQVQGVTPINTIGYTA